MAARNAPTGGVGSNQYQTRGRPTARAGASRVAAFGRTAVVAPCFAPGSTEAFLAADPRFQQWAADEFPEDDIAETVERAIAVLRDAWWIDASYTCPMYARIAQRFDACMDGHGSDYDYDPTRLGETLDQHGIVVDDEMTWVEENGPLIDALADAQYAATQQAFRDARIEHLTVSRGINVPREYAEELDGYLTDEPVDPGSAPLASWTTERSTAVGYARTGGDGRPAAGVVFEMTVPVSDVFATGGTGFGSTVQDEVVLIARTRHRAEAVAY